MFVCLVTLPLTFPTASGISPGVLGEKTLLHTSSHSSVILPARVTSPVPVNGPLPAPPKGIWSPSVLLLADALPASKPLISISGQSFHLPVLLENVFLQSLLLAESFHHVFQSSCDFLLPVPVDLSAHLPRFLSRRL